MATLQKPKREISQQRSPILILLLNEESAISFREINRNSVMPTNLKRLSNLWNGKKYWRFLCLSNKFHRKWNLKLILNLSLILKWKLEKVVAELFIKYRVVVYLWTLSTYLIKLLFKVDQVSVAITCHCINVKTEKVSRR